MAKITGRVEPEGAGSLSVSEEYWPEYPWGNNTWSDTFTAIPAAGWKFLKWVATHADGYVDEHYNENPKAFALMQSISDGEIRGTISVVAVMERDRPRTGLILRMPGGNIVRRLSNGRILRDA